MAISFANEGASSGTTITAPDFLNAVNNQTSVASPSWTPAQHDLVLAVVTYRIGTSAPTVSMSGNGLTWVQIGLHNDGTTAGIALFAADNSGGGASAGVTTVSYSAATKGTLVGFAYVDGVDLSGGVAAAFVQAVTGEGGSSPASLTLSSAGASGNRPFACFDHYSEEDTTPATGWSELDDFYGAVVNSQSRSCNMQYRTDQFDTAPGASWATTTDNWCGIAVEIKAATGGGGSVSGSGTANLRPIQASGAADALIDASGTGNLRPIQASGAADVAIEGTGTGNLRPIAASGSGSVAIDASGAGSVGPIAATAAGDVAIDGAGAADLMPISSSGSGGQATFANGASNLRPIAASGSGAVDVDGAGAATTAPIAASASGTVDVSGSGAADLRPIAASGAGDVSNAGAGAADLMPISAAGAGTIGAVASGSGAADLMPIAASGAAEVAVDGSAAASLEPLVAAGAAGVSVAASGTADLMPVAVSASGFAGAAIAGDGAADLQPIAASGGGIVVGILEGFEVARGSMGYGTNKRRRRFATGQGRTIGL